MTEEEFESLADGSWKYEIESLREEIEELRIQLKQERQDHGHNIRQLKITASEMLKGKDEQLENCKILVSRIENERNACLEELHAISEALGTDEGHSSVYHIKSLREQLAEYKKQRNTIALALETENVAN